VSTRRGLDRVPAATDGGGILRHGLSEPVECRHEVARPCLSESVRRRAGPRRRLQRCTNPGLKRLDLGPFLPEPRGEIVKLGEIAPIHGHVAPFSLGPGEFTTCVYTCREEATIDDMPSARYVRLMKALLSAELLSLAALWRAGTLLDPGNPSDRIVGILRIVAIVWMVWTTYSTIAILSSSRPRFTNRLARALVHRAVAAAILTGVATAPTPAFAVTAQIDSSGVPIPPGAFVRPGSSERSTTTESVSVRSTTSVVVEPGDSLWRIAERHVRSIEADPAPRRIATYWARVVAVNADRLLSHNPDLIYPGETVILP